MVSAGKLGLAKMLLLMILVVSTSVDGDNNEQYIEQKLQQCMRLVDYTVIEALKNRGLKLNNKIITLCHADKRNKAQNEAIDYAIALHGSLDLATYRKCRRLAPGEKTEVQVLAKQYFISNLRFTHACDLIKP
ncbi:MAG: hypothetical protein COB77_04710 [Gammaproteobacteria bacterium]|nr:MAG: hypothetical protein COB77_04710 [Gammaproteobacteria bacterium]